MFTAMISLMPPAPRASGADLHLSSTSGKANGAGTGFEAHLEAAFSERLCGSAGAANCSGVMPPPAATPSPVVLPSKPEEFLAALEANIATLADRLEKIMQKVGADPGWVVQLHVGADGAIRVMGDTPFQMQVQEALDNDPELQKLIQGIVGDASLWASYQESESFLKAYREDPKQALADYGPNLHQGPQAMTMLLFQGGQARVEKGNGEAVIDIPAPAAASLAA